jgi:hypothetical protein
LFSQGYRELLESNIIVRQYHCIVRSSKELKTITVCLAGICSEVRLTEAVYANLAKDHNTRTDAEEA